jgi:4-amino-4-deoxy-L-arabinose transferase-like glycosyltransferase
MNAHKIGVTTWSWKKMFLLFLLMWFAVNLIQSIFTEMMSDESYYFIYGENLAWGYFDHPPMVGLMVYISSLLFEGNLSVRFVTLILQLFTLLLIWKTAEEQSPSAPKVALFFTIAASLIMFQVYGFVTAPDAPLLFFTALFLLSYKKFLKNESWLNTCIFAISMAGLVYSKYHAALIIGFVFLSHVSLLSRRKVWIAGCLALLLLTPHFYWQIANDFPTFGYHLSDRSSAFRWRYFWEFIPNQLAVFNPFTFGAVVYILIKYKPKEVFERGLYFLTVGFIAFFWITSFRGHVEPHWTVACSIPMLILLYRRSLENRKLMLYVKKGIASSILLILVARVLLAAGLLPKNLGFSGKKEKSEAIAAVAGDLPVAFTGSFQSASNYHYFTGKEAFVLSAIASRQTQFDILEKELSYQGKPAFIFTKDDERSVEYTINGETFYGYFAQSLQSVNRVKIEYDLAETKVHTGDTLHISFVAHNPTNRGIDFYHPEFPVKYQAAYRPNVPKNSWRFVDCKLFTPCSFLPAKGTERGILTAIVPDVAPGSYQFTLTLVNSICAARNSHNQLLDINRDDQ